MKQIIIDKITQALSQLATQQQLQLEELPAIQIERTRNPEHGDFACNIAMALAKQLKQRPRDIAKALVDLMPCDQQITAIDIAGPGFINFHMSKQELFNVINEILAAGDDYGHNNSGQGRTIHLEYVSCNPTGPLHVGHGRGAAYGSAVAKLLKACDFNVHQEYYLNDAGRQMDILAVSVWIRYLELTGDSINFPEKGYQGEYIQDIAQQFQQNYQDSHYHSPEQIQQHIAQQHGKAIHDDAELYIDALINTAKSLISEDIFTAIRSLALQTIQRDIQKDLENFGVVFDEWFSEASLFDKGAISHIIEKLQHAGYLYERDGATWFRSTDFGDEKDRVLVRDNGQATYFAPDIAYHYHKFQSNYDIAIDVFGADHHGYTPRLKAAMQALDIDPERLNIALVQFATLYRGKVKVQMSTRSGSYVTLRELIDEVGKDAARFFYLMRKAEQHMDFDLELAKSQSNENPVYYIQYAHARIASVQRQLTEKNYQIDCEQGLANLDRLNEPQEKNLCKNLSRYPEVIEIAGNNCEPHTVAHYLRELANDFHSYYNAHQLIVEDAELRNARLCLIKACQQTIANGLGLLGVHAPESM